MHFLYFIYYLICEAFYIIFLYNNITLYVYFRRVEIASETIYLSFFHKNYPFFHSFHFLNSFFLNCCIIFTCGGIGPNIVDISSFYFSKKVECVDILSFQHRNIIIICMTNHHYPSKKIAFSFLPFLLPFSSFSLIHPILFRQLFQLSIFFFILLS